MFHSIFWEWINMRIKDVSFINQKAPAKQGLFSIN